MKWHGRREWWWSGNVRGIHADVPGPEDVLLAGDHVYADGRARMRSRPS